MGEALAVNFLVGHFQLKEDDFARLTSELPTELRGPARLWITIYACWSIECQSEQSTAMHSSTLPSVRQDDGWNEKLTASTGRISFTPSNSGSTSWTTPVVLDLGRALGHQRERRTGCPLARRGIPLEWSASPGPNERHLLRQHGNVNAAARSARVSGNAAACCQRCQNQAMVELRETRPGWVEVSMFSRPPTIYLDHWALRRISARSEWRHRFIEALQTCGTLFFSVVHLAEPSFFPCLFSHLRAAEALFASWNRTGPAPKPLPLAFPGSAILVS